MENHIKEYRKAVGMTQKELGAALGTSGANVSSWEVGRTDPTVAQVVKMAKIFGCNIGDLFGPSFVDYIRLARLQAYANALASLNDRDRETVEMLIDRLSFKPEEE